MAKYNVIGQFIFISASFKWKVLLQRLSNVIYYLTNAFNNVFAFKFTDHFCYFSFPIRLPNFLMNAFITQYSQLVIVKSDIDQCRVSLLRFSHLQLQKYFFGPVDRVNKAAAAFYEDPYLAAGALFCLLYRRYQPGLFFFREEFFLLLPGKFHYRPVESKLTDGCVVLKSTRGAFSDPAAASNGGRGLKPMMPAKILVGNDRTFTL